MPPRETAGHEAYHFWRSRASRADYTSLAVDEVQGTGPEFFALYDHINEQYFDDAFDMDDSVQYQVFEKEVVAYISG